jgi:cytochrome c oxidase subunit 2
VGYVVLYSIFRFRARPGDGEAHQDFGNRRLEIAWTLGPALILAVITVFTAQALAKQEVDTSRPPDKQQPDLWVIGHQWWWEFRYPSTNVVTANELHIPVGKPLLVQLDAADVIHDFWVPELGPKMDTVPGQTNWMWLQADVARNYYPGACAEYCGNQHAWMLFRVVAEPEDQFQAWLQREGAPAAQSTDAAVQRGAQLFTQKTCINCHAIAGVANANALAGPNLTHYGSRSLLGAGVLNRSPENTRKWLENPQAVKPGNSMPNVRLTTQELDDLTAYMESLK